MKKKAFAATFAVLFTTNVPADTIGLYLGGQIWQSEASGLLAEQNTIGDFTLKKGQQNSYFIAVEHPIAILPNVRISSATLDTTSGTTHLTQEYNADNETAHVDVHADIDIDTNFNVSYVDYTLYYELFDNGSFSFDLGLTARDFGGAVIVTEDANIVTTSRDRIWDGEDHDDHDYHNVTETTETVTTDKIKTNEVEPMLYVASNISLPLSGLSLFIQGDFSLKDDQTHSDYQVGLSYELVDNRMMDFYLTLGYRAEKMEFEKLNDLYTDLEFKGTFVGVTVHF
ncbi:hypothetical protein tinsulaeT_06750 [Thalassotalea insulae]|uniref:TIGR04219 family outer membrane beta-barrel protein n=1 Tax=Thalassotalea insulae TaxID=2056778 RepID=A0ABQ6GSC7_9GAMM|nr:TIGR04219 family outer membrane beta-barrel protein [Thalassotalea insulae]GLX77335.1 hypothetical protein tinsulaeT_06750 [Thalassotalea insulae]